MTESMKQEAHDFSRGRMSLEIHHDRNRSKLTPKKIRDIVAGCRKCKGFKKYSKNAEYPMFCRLGDIMLETAMRCNRNCSNTKWFNSKNVATHA